MNKKDQDKKWEEEVLIPALENLPERKERYTTGSGIPMPRVALPDEDPVSYTHLRAHET